MSINAQNGSIHFAEIAPQFNVNLTTCFKGERFRRRKNKLEDLKKYMDKRREISNECKNVQGLLESSFLYERNSGNSSYLH